MLIAYVQQKNKVREKKMENNYGAGRGLSCAPSLEKCASSSSGMVSTGEGGMLIFDEAEGDLLWPFEGDCGGVRSDEPTFGDAGCDCCCHFCTSCGAVSGWN